MSYILSAEKQTAVITALAEGNSIRSIERMTGVHRDTVMRLGVRMGEGCAAVMDSQMRNLDCNLIQMDEIWGFVSKKQKNATKTEQTAGFGDAYTFVAIDAESRMVPPTSLASATRSQRRLSLMTWLPGSMDARNFPPMPSAHTGRPLNRASVATWTTAKW